MRAPVADEDVLPPTIWVLHPQPDFQMTFGYQLPCRIIVYSSQSN